MNPATKAQIKKCILKTISIPDDAIHFLSINPQYEFILFRQYFGKNLILLTDRLIHELKGKYFYILQTKDFNHSSNREKIKKLQYQKIESNSSSDLNNIRTIVWFKTMIRNEDENKIMVKKIIEKINRNNIYIFAEKPCIEIREWLNIARKISLCVRDIDKLKINDYITFFLLNEEIIQNKINKFKDYEPITSEKSFLNHSCYYVARIDSKHMKMHGYKFEDFSKPHESDSFHHIVEFEVKVNDEWINISHINVDKIKHEKITIDGFYLLQDSVLRDMPMIYKLPYNKYENYEIYFDESIVDET